MWDGGGWVVVIRKKTCSQIPPVRTSSKTVVNRAPDGRGLPGASAAGCWRPPAGRPASGYLLPGRPPEARRAQPLEPILIPKLRICLADFPYLHCSINQRLFTLETCCGYGYDLARELFPRADFQGTPGARRTRQKCRALPAVRPYLRTNRFQGTRPLRRKENSSRGPRRRLRVRLRRRAKPASRRRNVYRLPFRHPGRVSAPLKRNFPMAQDRLTHVQPLFTWNPSPLRSFKFPLKYLLLPPRSAPGAVRPGLAP